MRKLSKKISMLMVLAMLVSLFSGVVSASAASSWSFYNKTTGEIVEVKETIEMESNQFADFDLYKDGKAFDTDVYTVKYESSDADVVWVDAKNGKLRADKFETAEAGDEAVISAKIENKNTGAKTTKSFTIVIAEEEVVEPEEETYTLTATVGGAVLGAEALVADKDYALAATVVNGDGEAVEATIAYTIAGAAVEKLNLKAGEYTVVVTATLDGEVIATEKYDIVVEAEAPEIVSKKQTALNAVEITLNNADWAKKFAENIKLSFFAGEVEIAELVKATEVDGATVKVTLYNNMAKDVDYKFAFNGYDCATTIKGANPEAPASIKVVGGNVAAGTDGALAVKFFTAEGVDITSDALKAQVQYTGTDDSVAIVGGQSIYFFEAGKAAVVNATFEMGYDAEGNEITDLKASGLYYSVNEYAYTNLNGYAISTAADTTGDANTTFGSTVTISLSDTEAGDPAQYLHAKYTRTKFDGSATDQIYVLGNPYKYYSTNESIIMVGETSGALTACSEGVASIYIKKDNGDGTSTVVGSVTVNVKGARTLTTFTASMTDRMVSTGTTLVDDITVAVVTKDQLGDYIGANWKVELVNPNVIANDNEKGLSQYLTYTTVVNNGQVTGIKLTPVATNIPAGETKIVTFKISATVGNVTKTWTNSVSIKNISGVAPASTVLEVSKGSVDMKLNQDGVDKYDVTVKLVKKDSAGYDLGLQEYTIIGDEKAAATGNNQYSIIIKKNSDGSAVAATIGDDAFVTDASDVITFNPVTGTATIKKTAKETYTIKVFKGVNGKAQLYATRTVSFTDSTAPITVVVKNTNVNVLTPADLKGALDFYRGTTKINDYIDSVLAVDYTANVNGKIYLKKIDVTVKSTEMNGNFKANGNPLTYLEEDVLVNQLFTVQ